MDYSMEHLLECMLLDPSAEPTDLPMLLLKTITNNFSDHEKIGSGGFADVYKGELHNGTLIAVKKLFHNLDMEEEKFIKEVGCLMKAKHKHIVRFLGYCSDTQGKIMNHEGKMIQAEERHRLLCFEFLHKGSLDKHITDVSEGLEWRTRYKIIKGICEGLHYLHQDIHIVHSDLKPANILLDENMVPKIADFGLARCFDENQSKTTTSKVMGTVGYMAPESFCGVITFKSDIYSLGIIIMEILTGQKGYCDIQNVLQSWNLRFESSQEGIWLQYVQECAEIGNQCIDPNPEVRPDTLYVIRRLAKMERTCGFTETDICALSKTQVLDVNPLDIWFPPFEPNSGIKCPVTLTSRTDDLIGVCIKPTFTDEHASVGYPYVWELPVYQGSENIKSVGECDPLSSSAFIRLWPHSSVTIYMTMRKQQPPLLQADKGMFDVVMVATKSPEDLEYLGQLWSRSWRSITYSYSWRSIINELGTVVHRATLRVAVTTDAARCQQDVVAVHQFILDQEPGPADFYDDVVSCMDQEPGRHVYYHLVSLTDQEEPGPGVDYNMVTCMDVHPSKPWLLVGYHSGHVSLWNYETQERIIRFEVVTHVEKFMYAQNFVYIAGVILSIKFIAGEQWFVAGDDNGYVHVYAYTTSPAENDKVKELKAHGDKAEVYGLAAYPKHTLLLTASKSDKSIKLWDWSQGWTCTRVIHADTSTEDPFFSRLWVGPRDTGIFACNIDYGKYIEVWDFVQSPLAIARLQGSTLFAFCTDGHRDFVASLPSDHNTSSPIKIWDLQTEKHVHSLYSQIWPWTLCYLVGHRTLPLLVGILRIHGSKVHRIVLWDVRTYRVMKWAELLLEVGCPKMLFDGMEDITSLVIYSGKEISVIKINAATLLTDC